MLVPPPTCSLASCFFIDECFMALIPLQELFSKVDPVIVCLDQGQEIDNILKLYRCLCFRLLSKPYIGHSMYMNHTSLND